MDEPTRRRRLLAAGLLLAITAGLGLITVRNNASPPPAGQMVQVPVTLAEVTRGDVPHLSSAPGTAQALNAVVIRSQVDGILSRLHFREGADVRKGDLLASMDDRAPRAALASAEAEQAQVQAELAAARVDLARYETAVTDGAVSRQVLEQQQALVRQLEAAVGARAAAVATARVTLDDTRIVAPLSGRVGIRRVDAGNVIRRDDPDGIVTLTQLAPIAVVFSLPQNLLPPLRRLEEGGGAVPVTAYDQLGGEELGEGVITTLDSAVDAATGTVRIKAEFPNSDGRLWPGQFVTVQVRTGQSVNVLVVPSRALQRGRSEVFVYREKDGVVEPVPVVVEYEDETTAAIASGLEAGDRVVTDGQSRLRPGARVKAVAPPAAGTPAS